MASPREADFLTRVLGMMALLHRASNPTPMRILQVVVHLAHPIVVIGLMGSRVGGRFTEQLASKGLWSAIDLTPFAALRIAFSPRPAKLKEDAKYGLGLHSAERFAFSFLGPSARSGMVRQPVWLPYRTAGARLAAYFGLQIHADLRAHRVRQDAGGVSCLHR